MDNGEFKALMSSLARIELLIVTLMKSKYGEKEGKRVYNEVVETVDKAFDMEVSND